MYQRSLRLVGATVLVLSLAACGSRLDPNEVATAGVGQQVGTTGEDGSIVSGDGGAVVDGSGETTGSGGDATTDSGSTGAGDTGSTGGGTAAAPTTGKGSATGGVKAASCDGFKNQLGITDKTITLGNVADISGPVPGIFESTQQAARAYVEYFNSQGDICGRKLAVSLYDSRADAGADQQAYVKACDETFATVGSMSAFDTGGASTASDCGIPDIRAVSVSSERQACKSCFATYAITTGLIPTSFAKYLAQKFPTAVKNAAVLYINAGAAVQNAKSMAAGYEKGAGWKVNYVQGIDVAEFNFAPYVQQMKSKGIKAVGYQGPYQNTVKIQQAMQQQGFKADFFWQDPTIYDARYLEQAGSLAEGTYVYAANALFEDKSNAEVQLYLAWLQQVKPGAIPNYYGLYAWSATRLFVEKAIALGGKLSRTTLVDALNKTTSWTGNGAHTAMNLATNATPGCLKAVLYKGGKWQQVSPGAYMCGSVVSTGLN